MDGLVMRTWLHGLTMATSNSANKSKNRLRSLQSGRGKMVNLKRVALNHDVVLEGRNGNSDGFEGRNGNWVLKILQVGSVWNNAGEKQGQNGNFTPGCDHGGSDEECKERCSDGCGVCNDHDHDDDDEEIDRETFTKMLKKVSLTEAKLFAKLSYLGGLAYVTPIIKPKNMLKRYGLKYITSSIEKREELSSETDHSEENSSMIENAEYNNHKKGQTRLNASAAIEIAASAASFLHNHTKSIVTILPLRDSRDGVDHDGRDFDGSSNMASLRATTGSVTAVVAAKEEVKQAVADDLNSMLSSPCEWYICDDDKTSTRYFVIQGSETLASWQANLLFEPVQFEGLDVLVHRGIYEAAKGIYQQMLPEVEAFMKAHGEHAKFRFTGHSLGGSLSMLINLMLLIRGVVPYSSLLPVITFGAPCIMCGGDYLLHKLGLPKSHVQAIMMHRDIVPRVFSCYYPKPAAELLKAVNGNFRNHPCLNNQKLLYAPMGEMLILQPDPKHSPRHDLLPSYTGLFLLTSEAHRGEEAENQLRSAVTAFLNTPHPLEILSDRSAYGSDGAILRGHDINSYLKTLRSVIRLELGQLRKARKKDKAWWYLRLPRVIGGTNLGSSHVDQTPFRFPRMQISESLKRLTGLVKSQHMGSVLVFVGTYSMIENGMRSQF